MEEQPFPNEALNCYQLTCSPVPVPSPTRDVPHLLENVDARRKTTSATSPRRGEVIHT
jgi:hypothetical protein